ncbi:MAG: DUF2336 domain-containing protein [Lactobacillaceae bacterium]|jgi:hypothetical protein|nr:DUF2336 domain-containing protein [Lactobacillaceae bacterium]
MANATLTKNDINKLSQDMSAKTKTEAIKKAGHYNDASSTDNLTLKISENSTDKETEAIVKQLYSLERLTPTLVARSMCMGDLKFFEYALSYLTKRNIKEIREILRNTEDEYMIRNIMREARISNTFFPAVIAALKIIYELNFDMRKESRENFIQKVVERVLTFDSVNEKMDIKDIQYLISKIS